MGHPGIRASAATRLAQAPQAAKLHAVARASPRCSPLAIAKSIKAVMTQFNLTLATRNVWDATKEGFTKAGKELHVAYEKAVVSAKK